MIINIRLTDRAVKHVIDSTGLDEESATEFAQEIITLCEKSGSPGPGKASDRENRLEAVIWNSFQALKGFGVDVLGYRLDALPKAIEDVMRAEGEKKVDRIPNSTARKLRDLLGAMIRGETVESRVITDLFEELGDILEQEESSNENL